MKLFHQKNQVKIGSSGNLDIKKMSQRSGAERWRNTQMYDSFVILPFYEGDIKASWCYPNLVLKNSG